MKIEEASAEISAILRNKKFSTNCEDSRIAAFRWYKYGRYFWVLLFFVS